MTGLSEQITKRILNKLQGWVTVSNRDENELNEMEYDNTVTEEELELFYAQALNSACSYCYLETFPVFTNTNGDVEMDNQFQEAVINWCAGLVWRKYDIRANDQVEETGSYVVSYGDQLIIDAKNILQPFVHKSVGFW